MHDRSGGGLSVSVLVPGADLILLDLLRAYGLTREETAEARMSLHEIKQPLKVSSTGKVVSWTDPPGSERAQEKCRPPSREAHPRSRPMPLREEL